MKAVRHLALVPGVVIAVGGVVCLRVDRWLASIDIHDVEGDPDDEVDEPWARPAVRSLKAVS